MVLKTVLDSCKDKSDKKIVKHFADSSLGESAVSLVRLSFQIKLRSLSPLIFTGNQVPLSDSAF